MASKYDSRRIWMNTGASAKLKNLALEEKTVRRTQRIYREAQKDIEAQVAQIYSQIGTLSKANRWEFPDAKTPAKRKDISSLIKAIDKAGLTDYVPEKLSKRMSVLQVKEMNIWLRIHEAGQESHAATKDAILKTMQNSGKAWVSALAAGADSFVGFDRNICGYMMGMNWADGNFSSRLWNASETTWEKVRDELTRALANGQQPETTKAHIKNLLTQAHNPDAKGSGGIAYDVERIIRTENAKASTDADMARWKDAGVTKIQWNAVLEKNTCSPCADRDGRVYLLKDIYKLDTVPLHPNCRCFFTAYDETAAKYPDTTYYKNEEGKYKEVQWAPYRALIDNAGNLRASPLSVSDYFWKLSPWTTYKPPKTNITFKGELDDQVVDLAQRTIKAVTDQYPEIADRLESTFGNEVTIHRNNSIFIGHRIEKGTPGLTDEAFKQLTFAYPDRATGGNPLTQLAKQATEQYKKGFWSTPKDNHTIMHELGHVLEIDLKRTRGVDPETLILRATGTRTWKQAKAVLERNISRYAAEDPGEAFAEIFARMASQDPSLQTDITARFTDALEEARKKPIKKTKIKVTEISKVAAEPKPKGYTTESGWINSLTKSELQAIKDYTNDASLTGYTDINGALRDGKYKKGYKAPIRDGWVTASEERLQKVSEAVDGIDRAMAKFTLTTDKTVWRGFREDLMSDSFLSKMENLKPGSVLTDEAYSSTAVTKSGTGEFTGGWLMKIKVPAGTGRGIYTRKLSDFAQENEMLLKRGAQFKVTRITNGKDSWGNTVKLIEAEMLP